MHRCSLGFVAAFVLGACQGGSTGPAPSKRPVPVVVAAVELREMPIELASVGSAEAVSSVDVLPQVGGQIEAVHFKEGQAVHKGDLLFTIDTRPYRASLSIARADLDRQRALAEQAKREVSRYEALVKEGLASDQELSQQRAQASALSASLAAGRAAVTSNSLNVQFAAIRSPIDGRTGTLLVHAGNVVKANDRALVVVRSIAPIYVRFSLSEQYLSTVRAAWDKGPIAVKATAHGGSGPSVTGELTFIENAVDTSTGKIDMKAKFENAREELWPGQYVDVTLRVGTEKDATVVPESAIQIGQEGAYAYVVADGKALLRKVEVERSVGDQSVVKRGLAAGEQVVTDGQIRLRDGASVEIKPAPPPAPTQSAPGAPAPPAPSPARAAGEVSR